VCWIAAYALALHTILIGLAGVPAVPLPDGSDSNFEICHTDVDGDANKTAPNRPAHVEHCKGCIAGGTALAPPTPAAIARSFTPSQRIAHAIASERPASPELYREQARGPPAEE
jgi:hypothetical protein